MLAVWFCDFLSEILTHFCCFAFLVPVWHGNTPSSTFRLQKVLAKAMNETSNLGDGGWAEAKLINT